MVDNDATAIMYGLNPDNPSDLLIEYLIKSNEQGVKSLLIGFGIMADTQSKQIMGLRTLIASGDEQVIFKVIALDPMNEIHEEAFKRTQAQQTYSVPSTNHESLISPKPIINDKETSYQFPKKILGNDFSLMELLIFLICVFVLVKIVGK
jgi:hypothetical protein